MIEVNDELAERLAAMGLVISPEHVEAAGGHDALVAMLQLQEVTALSVSKALLFMCDGQGKDGVICMSPLVALLGADPWAAEHAA